MTRAIVLVLDSFGIGAAPDAERFGDAGADTLGHIAAACARGECDLPQGPETGLSQGPGTGPGAGRQGPLQLPHLARLGLFHAHQASTGHWAEGVAVPEAVTGDEAACFTRTANRRDYSVEPPAPTVLQKLHDDGGTVVAIGKIADIYAHCGISRSVKASGHDALMDATLAALDDTAERSLVMTNFVDFDMVHGHRRDVAGYAAALEHFDARLPELLARLAADDLLVITADHGCDPTWTGSDHTREHAPVLALGAGLAPGSLGARETFADIGQSLADVLGLAPMDDGESFLPPADTGES